MIYTIITAAYYTPDNALIAIAGDFNTEEMLARLNVLYEGLDGRYAARTPNPR